MSMQQQLQQQPEVPGRRRPSISVDGNARVVTVRVSEGRIADWKGGVRDWAVIMENDGQGRPAGASLVNGVA